MKIARLHLIAFLVTLLLTGCGTDPKELMEQFDRLEEEPENTYGLIYATAAWLSTTGSVDPEEAIPLLNRMIALGYPAEARYSIDNLEANGIRSADLTALRGLCYQNELQPGLALAEYRKALEMDPDNEKIRTLIRNVHESANTEAETEDLLARASSLLEQQRYDASERMLDRILQQDELSHRALFMKGLIRLQNSSYDSAAYFMEFARSIEKLPEYEEYFGRIALVQEGEEMIVRNPATFRGYLQKSQGLAAMELYDEAHRQLDRGLQVLPGNVNLILAKALVWMQAGKPENARQYLWEQEQRGVKIDPALKERVLQTQN